MYEPSKKAVGYLIDASKNGTVAQEETLSNLINTDRILA